MEYKIDASIRTMADVVKVNNLPETKENYCKFCGCDMTHKIFGYGEQSRGLAYSCVRCGTTPFGIYDFYMGKCPKCGDERPHFAEYDCGQPIHVCSACGHKRLDSEIAEMLKSSAESWEKYGKDPEDHQGENDYYSYQYFKEQGLIE